MFCTSSLKFFKICYLHLSDFSVIDYYKILELVAELRSENISLRAKLDETEQTLQVLISVMFSDPEVVWSTKLEIEEQFQIIIFRLQKFYTELFQQAESTKQKYYPAAFIWIVTYSKTVLFVSFYTWKA